jgi:hypothetical protein
MLARNSTTRNIPTDAGLELMILLHQPLSARITGLHYQAQFKKSFLTSTMRDEKRTKAEITARAYCTSIYYINISPK